VAYQSGAREGQSTAGADTKERLNTCNRRLFTRALPTYAIQHRPSAVLALSVTPGDSWPASSTKRYAVAADAGRRVAINDAGHDTYHPWREHPYDDLVLALAIAAGPAENHTFRPATWSIPQGEIPTLSTQTLNGMYFGHLHTRGW
jgi:hypothetical protein